MLARGSVKIRTCSCPSKTLEWESTRKTKAAYLRRSLRLSVRVWDWVWRSAARSSKDMQAVWSSPKRALRGRHSRSPCLLCLLATHREPPQTRHLRRGRDLVSSLFLRSPGRPPESTSKEDRDRN